MRRILIALMVWVGMALGATAQAQVSGVAMISENYHIWGVWTQQWFNSDDHSSGSNSGSFDTSSSDGTPISISVASSPYQYSTAGASIDLLSYSLGMSEPPWGGVPIDFTGSHMGISADATWRFQPLNTSLFLGLDGSYDSGWPNCDHFQISLTDLSASTSLLSMDVSSPMPQHQTYNFTVDLSHEYEFRIFGWAGADDHSTTNFTATATISAPESSALFLLGPGLIGVALLRRKVKK
jgi:hypothetical protein